MTSLLNNTGIAERTKAEIKCLFTASFTLVHLPCSPSLPVAAGCHWGAGQRIAKSTPINGCFLLAQTMQATEISKEGSVQDESFWEAAFCLNGSKMGPQESERERKDKFHLNHLNETSAQLQLTGCFWEQNHQCSWSCNKSISVYRSVLELYHSLPKNIRLGDTDWLKSYCIGGQIMQVQMHRWKGQGSVLAMFNHLHF